MSWLQKLLPPKINRSDSTAKKTVPEGLWSKCQGCGTVLYSTDLEQNAQVCPKCDHHHRISARARLDLLLDPGGRFEIGAEVLPVDALKFKDSRRYSDRLVDAERGSGETESLVVLQGAIRSIPVVVAVLDFDFMAGTMGSVMWCAHAGRHAVADADGQDHRGVDATVGAPPAFHFRAHRSHHRRRLGQLCHDR